MAETCRASAMGVCLSRNSAARQPSAMKSSQDLISQKPRNGEKAPGANTQTLKKDARILIVGGGGTIGSSTALHLVRRGYTNVQIMDVYPIPSRQSAGNDLNKIIGTSGSGSRRWISKEIMNGWRTDPVFKPYYHEVGRLEVASLPEHVAALRSKYEKEVADGSLKEGIDMEWLETPEDIVRRSRYLQAGTIQDWRGYWRRPSGWAAAKDAIDSVGRELQRHGVKMTFGPSGTFDRPLTDDRSRCVGVVAQDGTKHGADRVILATGAWTPTLVDLEGQCVSKCWIVAHLELTAEEAERYQDIPVVYNGELGFLFEPRLVDCRGELKHLIKICDEFPGYTRYNETTPYGSKGPQSISVPRSHAAHPTDAVPEEGEQRLRKVVETMLPEFANRPFEETFMCWCTDTDDAEWLFCEYPSLPGLLIASGDSGHSFVTIPWVGNEVADMLEGKLSKEKAAAWCWRPGRGDPNGIGRGGPPPKDLGQLPGWAKDDDPEDI